MRNFRPGISINNVKNSVPRAQKTHCVYFAITSMLMLFRRAVA
jgi:hypothetical protein